MSFICGKRHAIVIIIYITYNKPEINQFDQGLKVGTPYQYHAITNAVDRS